MTTPNLPPIRLCVPGGIGDISWIYSKIKCLRGLTGREVLVSVAGDQPRRGGDLVSLLPEVKFAGYKDVTSFYTIIQSVPSDWPATMGHPHFFCQPEMLNVSANIHLEQGRPLANWLPCLPVNYHYPLAIPHPDEQRAAGIIGSTPEPRVAVYVSNRAKDAQKACGWSLWSAGDWCRFLLGMRTIPYFERATFVFLGAEYDRDKTEEVAAMVRDVIGANAPIKMVVAESLGTALACLKRCQYIVSYPGGIGILANVLSVPGVMLLPWLLKALETVYADPVDLSRHIYRAWADPTPDEVLDWITHVNLPMLGRV